MIFAELLSHLEQERQESSSFCLYIYTFRCEFSTLERLSEKSDHENLKLFYEKNLRLHSHCIICFSYVCLPCMAYLVCVYSKAIHQDAAAPLRRTYHTHSVTLYKWKIYIHRPVYSNKEPPFTHTTSRRYMENR